MCMHPIKGCHMRTNSISGNQHIYICQQAYRDIYKQSAGLQREQRNNRIKIKVYFQADLIGNDFVRILIFVYMLYKYWSSVL